MVGIYKITNKQTGEVYIGQSLNCERRISEHKQARVQTIDNYINVLGVENFDFEIIEECNENELDIKEQKYIQEYDSINNGYNYQTGGFNNSIGEGNGRAKLTEKDVIGIRIAYANHENPHDVYEKIKHTGISYAGFQSTWQGRSWSHIMPEVFTEENKRYYTSGMGSRETTFSPEDILRYRQYYVNHTAQETYNLYLSEKASENKSVKLETFKKILSGDVRDNSIYKNVPVYKKNKKQWFLHDQPVSTISESGE